MDVQVVSPVRWLAWRLHPSQDVADVDKRPHPAVFTDQVGEHDGLLEQSLQRRRWRFADRDWKLVSIVL